jgi:hypothetical protein
MLDALKKEIAAAAPAIDAQKKAAFLAAHAAVTAVPDRPNPKGLRNAPPPIRPQLRPVQRGPGQCIGCRKIHSAGCGCFSGERQNACPTGQVRTSRSCHTPRARGFRATGKRARNPH